MMVASQARQQMVMRARVLRPTSLAVNDYGEDEPDAVPDAHLDALACYAWAPTDVRQVLDASESVFGAVRLTAPSGVDIAEGDIVESVFDRRGGTVFEGPMLVTAVTRQAGHLAVMLRVQRGSGG